MGAEIDRLEIGVEAQATKANNALDKLVGKLERLAVSLGSINGNGLGELSLGVDGLGNAMQGMKNVGTTDFNRLAKNIEQIGSIDTSGINKTASAINRISASLGQPETVISGASAIGDLAKGIAKLGNKGVLTAIDNMPKLAIALNDMMNTLSKAPAVSNNLIDMTTALANLASQGNKVGSTTRSMTRSLNGYSASAQSAHKSSRGLASVFGSIYANFFWVKRGADKLWESITTSMDYVEVLNYFDAAFGQVAESAVSQWEDAGYASAEAYYKSFGDRAKQVTSKMTGFAVQDDGTLQATGQPSLGIDPSKLLNYQATFGQMSSSMGVAAETSLKLSQALTEIGGDLASVKNLDFDKVWNDMASGLAGMSRTLDKYGVNIRNVNLQQKLTELGIQANITALNQNDKALLRAIILLDSTRYAWGDLADTINQPANQLRLIESNFKNLSRTIGNLFLPTVTKVLPYVNALVISLQRLATWLGNLLGIDLSGITSSVADSAFDFGSIADEAEEATAAVDKLQKGIRKFDELDVINTSSGSGSGSGSGISSGLLDDAFNKSFDEYQKAWDEAFSNMENKAQDLADKIDTFFAPVKKIFQDLFDGDFFAAGQDTSKLVAGIFNWFADAIAAVDWYKIGHNIGEFLDGIEWGKVFLSVGNFLETAVDAAIELWLGSFVADPIATTIVSALAVAKFLGLDTVLKDKFEKALPSKLKLSNGVKIVLLAATFEIGFNVGKVLGKALFPDDKEYYDNFTWFGEDGFFDTIKNTDFKTLSDAFNDMCSDIQDNDVYRILTGTFIMPKNSTIKQWKEDIKTIPDAFNDVKDCVANWFTENVSPWLSKEKWDELGENIKSSLNNKWDEFENNWENTGVYKWFTNDVSPWLSKEKWSELGNNTKEALSSKWNEFSSWWKNTGFAKWWNDVASYFSKDKWTWDGIEKGLSQAWENAIASVKGIWNKFADWLNDKLNFSWDSINIAGKEIIPGGEINLGKIPKFESGGYVPTRYSLFMAGENGTPEMAGTVGGKTAVAGGAEITGIKDAVYATSQQEIALLRQQNELLRELVSKEFGISQDDIGKSARRYAQEYYRRTGEPAYL